MAVVIFSAQFCALVASFYHKLVALGNLAVKEVGEAVGDCREQKAFLSPRFTRCWTQPSRIKTSLYLDSLSNGDVLSAKLYS